MVGTDRCRDPPPRKSQAQERSDSTGFAGLVTIQAPFKDTSFNQPSGVVCAKRDPCQQCQAELDPAETVSWELYFILTASLDTTLYQKQVPEMLLSRLKKEGGNFRT